MSLPFDTSKEQAETTEPILEHLQDDEYPHLTELAALQATTSTFDYDTEFEFGLNLVLNALDAIRTEA